MIKPTGLYEHLAYQSDNKLTIELRPLTKEEEVENKKKKFGYTGERLSLNFQNIEVRAVLQLIADFTEKNLVASDTVGGNVTLRLKNVPWDQALDIILKSRGLDKREIGNVMMVQLEASAGPAAASVAASWRVDASMAGLGTSMNVGVHVYDILRYLLSSEIEMVSTFFDTPRGVMEEVSMSTFRFTNGVIAHVNVHEKAPYPFNDYVIHCSKGRITGKGLTRSRASGDLEVVTSDGKTRVTPFPAINAHEACVVAFRRNRRTRTHVSVCRGTSPRE